jgi:DNA-nicking Smr family endonuclease
MPGRSRLPLPAEPEAPKPEAAAPPPATPPKLVQAPAYVGIGATPVGLDKSTWKKFRDGKMRAEAKLDLHGHTAAKAHMAVRTFLEQCFAMRMRCVEIITGNGEILARELPHWLNAPGLRPLILAVTHPHAANTGSVRILLRRGRA